MSEPAYIERPDGQIVSVHGRDLGQVDRLCERPGYRRLRGKELREHLETTDAVDEDVHDGHA